MQANIQLDSQNMSWRIWFFTVNLTLGQGNIFQRCLNLEGENMRHSMQWTKEDVALYPIPVCVEAAGFDDSVRTNIKSQPWSELKMDPARDHWRAPVQLAIIT